MAYKITDACIACGAVNQSARLEAFLRETLLTSSTQISASTAALAQVFAR